MPTSRWPPKLPETTVAAVLASPLPSPVVPRNRGDRVLASIVIVTYDNLVFNKLCLVSVLLNTEDLDYEIVVVDNGSTDGTLEYLSALEHRFGHLRVLRNTTNRGFAAANNQGLENAKGEILVLLNNDTVVPHGWLGRLARWLEDPQIGLVGPVTNRAANEQEIEVPYRTYGEFLTFADEHAIAEKDKSLDIRAAFMFCTALRRDVYRTVGGLDERFEMGLFEDDDYALRVARAGYRVVCAEDVFVHHFGQATLGKLAGTGEYGTLFHANRARWEQKWGIAWKGHKKRPRTGYRDLVEAIRNLLEKTLPQKATVVVVSRGDDDLLDLPGRRAWHFPRALDGGYGGHHPANSTAAIAHLEELRASGAEFLVLPQTSFWWLEHYADFRLHVERQHKTLHKDETCQIFALGPVPSSLPER